MHRRFRARTIAIGGVCLVAGLATGAQITPVHAQAMQVVGPSSTGSSSTGSSASGANPAASSSAGFNPYDPQWARAAPFGFNSAASGVSQQAYVTKFGSGTVALFSASNSGDTGARSMGGSGNFFDPLPFSPMLQQNWSSGLSDPAWRSSFAGTYKSDTALNGLYTTASFGVTNFRSSFSGLPGLTNFSAGNDAVGVTARAGVGIQITPQVSFEGSVGFSQMPASASPLSALR